jgi:hypothetical protein
MSLKKKMTDESIWENILPQLRQIGGKHYKNFKIQPFEFISKNNLSFYQGVVIKSSIIHNLKYTS